MELMNVHFFIYYYQINLPYMSIDPLLFSVDTLDNVPNFPLYSTMTIMIHFEKFYMSYIYSFPSFLGNFSKLYQSFIFKLYSKMDPFSKNIFSFIFLICFSAHFNSNTFYFSQIFYINFANKH